MSVNRLLVPLAILSVPFNAMGAVVTSHYLCFDASTIAGCGTNASPFVGQSFSYFHLEDFEDHALNAPGVTADVGGPTSVVFGPSIHDSVDADDGIIDGSGLNGDSYFSGYGYAGITFTFDQTALGVLPTHAGIVWTDGAGSTSFSAWDAFGALIDTTTVDIADGSYNGETVEDTFFGVQSSLGISKILISNSGGGIEVDHLQYGLASTTTSVAEPATVGLLGAGLFGLMLTRRRQILHTGRA